MFAVLTAGAFGSAASAEEAAECKDFPAALDKIAAMQVIGSAPAHFFEAWVDGCERSVEHCQKRSYVLPGDRVFAEDAGAGFFCAWYLDGKGRESWGLLPAARLAQARTDGPATDGLSGWASSWRMIGLAPTHVGSNDDMTPEVEIAMVADGGALKAASHATYPYKTPSGELRAHAYESDAAVVLKGGLATIIDEDCRIQMRRSGDLLVATDNGQCGGLGVTFLGFYRRVRATQP